MKSSLSERMLKSYRRGRALKRRNQRRGYSVETLEPRHLLATIGTGFTAGSGPGFVPPDTMGAVGPDAIVELINGRFAVYDKTGAQQTASTLDQFWIAAGVTPTGSFSFDPRVLYDTASGRWFAVSVDNPGAANNFLVAVSNSSDPTAGWTGFQIDSDADNSHWADFPMLGMNQDVLTISANMFDLGNGSANASFLVVPKSGLLATPPTVANSTLIEDVTLTGFSSQPVVDLDDGGLPLNILSSFNKPAGTLKASSIVGTPAAPTVNTAGGTIAVTPRPAPPDIDQPGPKTNIDAGDNRFGGNVIQQQIVGRANPSLWGVQGVEINGRAAIEWYEIDALTYGVVQSGTIEDPSLAFNYPSIAVNDFGDVAIGFSGGDPSTFMSTYVVTGQTSGGVTTFDPIIQTHAGVADYENLDGIGRNRWGDYSATVIDPTDQLTMWTFQEFASGVDQWSVRVTEIIFAPPSEIHGLVWQDENTNGVRDTGERGIPNWTVYLDINDSGGLDPNEPSAVTDAAGLYILETGVGPGTYTVAQILPPLWEHTLPASGKQAVTISQRSQIIQNVNFGNRPVRGSVSGIKWNDLDSDGIHDPDEPGMQGVYIYADINRNGSIALGEPAAITDANGAYQIPGVPPGEIMIREVVNPGWTMTYPALGYHLVDVEPGEDSPNVDFGNAASDDFGDAPAPYPTLIADNGAAHGVLPGFQLGELIDGEDNGLPQANAIGDDMNDLPDEDGVIISGPMFAGSNASVQVIVSTGPYPEGNLQAWIDFNGDGDWNDAGEQIAKDLMLGEGTHTLHFAVPVDVAVGQSFARFRYGFERGMGPTGTARAGEVEDHAVLLLKDEPVANPDDFEVLQDSSNVILDVLANDFPSSTGTLTIVGITQPARGTVSITPGGSSVTYTPDRGTFSPPDDVFSYTIGDGTGKTDSASVTVFVRPQVIVPVAVDDAYQISAGSSNDLHVLENDLPGILGTMQIASVSDPASGTATINDNGTPADPLDDYIVYVPDGSFNVVDQFQYTISNANGTSTATVTLFESPPPGDQSVDLSIDITDPDGNPISEVNLGDEFVLTLYVEDTRIDPVAPGVAAAYLDILYDRNLALPNIDSGNPLGFEIFFAPDYENAIAGDADTPGLLNELGGFQISNFRAGRLEVFSVVFTANAVGEVTFTGDPADLSPDHDVLLYQPPSVVALADIHYGFNSVVIVDPNAGTDGDGEGEPLDVNEDGHITPLDALLVINYLNTGGPTTFTYAPPTRLDVNGDRFVSPIDALMVINHLNNHGEGEGEGSFLPTDPANRTAAALPDLLTDGSAVLTTLDITQSHSTDTERLPLLLTSVPIAVPALHDDWQSWIGTNAEAPTIPLAADQVVGQSWEALLDTLAEDVLEAWLDGGDL